MDSLEFASDASSPTSDDGFVGGLSDPSSLQFKKRRNLLNIVNTLHSYGLEKQLDLPQIAVVGSQSAGKSSLIEAISGITLPRAKGTCTRCPIECRLSSRDAEWSCGVYLRRASLLQEIEFGPPMTNKAEVEERIRRAQFAILNPSRDYKEFLEASSLPDRNEHSFSEDLISVRISGQDVDDLSFVDLPGIIQAVGDEGRAADIKRVKDLIKSFIKKPSCLILLVVTCEYDIDNQGARQLAKQFDPTGDRTMPVLTKPDRIAAGEESDWVARLQNQKERYKHGWHSVKQLDQRQLERGLEWKDARILETQFFDEEAPWSTLDATARSRLGTENLTGSLGTTLFSLICRRLPSILQEVDSTIVDTRYKLSKLPEKLEGEPSAIVYDLIDQYKHDISGLITGRAEDGADGLIQSFRRDGDVFTNSIFRQAPCFRPYAKPGSNDPSFKNDTGEYPSTVKDEEKLEPTGTRDPATFVYFDQVLEMAKNARTRELPNNTPFAVKKSYIERFTKGWEDPAENLFKQIEKRLSDRVKNSISSHFKHYNTGGLEGAVLRIVATHLEKCSAVTLDKIKDCYALEADQPFTANHRDFQEYRSKFVDLYRQVRREYLKVTTGSDSGVLENAMHALRNLGFTLKIDSLARILAPDEADDAIEIMAEVRAYYQVAYKRFIDYIPMIIDHNLLQSFDRGLVKALTQGLQLGKDGASQRCTEFLQEDPTVEHARDSLTHRLQRFEAARAELQNIPGVLFMAEEDIDNNVGVGEEEDEEDSPGYDDDDNSREGEEY